MEEPASAAALLEAAEDAGHDPGYIKQMVESSARLQANAATLESAHFKIRYVSSLIDSWGHPTMTLQTDNEPAIISLAKEVKSRLKWNWTTHPAYDKIDVTVKNGVAILDGEVNRWSERREAGHVALHTEGVWTVDNRLTVHGYNYPWEEWHAKGPYAYDPLYNPYDNYNYDSPWW